MGPAGDRGGRTYCQGFPPCIVAHFPFSFRGPPQWIASAPFGLHVCQKTVGLPLGSPSLRPLSKPSPMVEFPGLGLTWPRLCLEASQYPPFLERCWPPTDFFPFLFGHLKLAPECTPPPLNLANAHLFFAPSRFPFLRLWWVLRPIGGCSNLHLHSF